MNFYINTFDVSHNVMPKGGKCVDRSSVGQGTTCNYILGSTEGGGCVMCHSSSNPSSPDYSTLSVGFFDKTHKLFTNPAEDDTACGTSEGVVQTTIGGIKRVAVKLATIKSDGTPNTIDVSNVADCAPVGNTLNQGEVLGYTSSRQAALMNLNNCAACHTVVMSPIKHPTGSGTPGACTSCHTTQHQSALDVNVACGSCHGGGTSKATNPPQAGIMWYDTTTLAVYAAGMHDAAKLPPTVSHTGGAAVVKSTATSIVDTSVDNNGNAQSTLSILINWGDGSVSTGVGGATFTHTYANAGVYNVVHTATDSGGRTASEAVFQVKVFTTSAIKTTVKITVTNAALTPIQGARLYLKKAGRLVTTGYSNADGEWTFKNLIPDPGTDYTVAVYKSGLDFGKGNGKAGTDVAIDATVDNDTQVISSSN
jgi:hypothetical protein